MAYNPYFDDNYHLLLNHIILLIECSHNLAGLLSPRQKLIPSKKLLLKFRLQENHLPTTIFKPLMILDSKDYHIVLGSYSKVLLETVISFKLLPKMWRIFSVGKSLPVNPSKLHSNQVESSSKILLESQQL